MGGEKKLSHIPLRHFFTVPHVFSSEERKIWGHPNTPTLKTSSQVNNVIGKETHIFLCQIEPDSGSAVLVVQGQLSGQRSQSLNSNARCIHSYPSLSSSPE